MALVWLEGFEGYTTLGNPLTNYMIQRWVQVNGSGNAAAGRNGGLATTAYSTFSTPVLTPDSTWIVGFAFKSGAVANYQDLLTFFTDDFAQVALVANNTTRRIEMWRGSLSYNPGGSVVLATSANTFGDNIWYHIQVKFVIDSSVGEVTLRINDVVDTALTGQNTKLSGSSSTANQVRFSPGFGGNPWLDDIWMATGTGGQINDIINPGDLTVETLLASGAGSHTDWTPLSGTNYSNIQDAIVDYDTSYVSASTPGDVDTYDYSSLAIVQSGIKGVCVNVVNRKDNAGPRTLSPVVYTGSTLYTGAAESVFDSYSYNQAIWEQNPNTSADWTTSDVNAAEFGQKLVS